MTTKIRFIFPALLNRLPLIILLVGLLNGLAAQEATLMGTVKDPQGQPVYLAQIYANGDKTKGTASEINGKFTLKLAAGTQTLYIEKIGFKPYIKSFYLKAGEERNIIAELKSNSKQLSEVEIKRKKLQNDPKQEISSEQIILKIEQSNPSGNIEQQLKYQGLGVGGNNELGSQYNVRGGNFDENLVYVNDFEIYRPLLLRSAQQEGLSFGNSMMVENIKFSSGGFKAEYGDKLSSVLDITYKRPKKFAGSIEAGLMGINTHIEAGDNSNYSLVAGLRYRDNSYLLSSQETKGSYTPKFIDYQHFARFYLSDNFNIDWLLNFNHNNFTLFPADRTTNFGLANFALSYQVQYSGQEIDKYTNFTNGVVFIYKPITNITLKYQNAYYLINESQNFDITGRYAIGELETDINSSNYQKLKSVLGAGTFQNWGRDRYKGTLRHNIFSAATMMGKHNLKAGFSNKIEQLEMHIDEWDRLDSADYTIPIGSQIKFPYVVYASHYIQNIRNEFFLQDNIEWTWGQNKRAGIHLGLRGNHSSLNNEFFLSPRFQGYLKPIEKPLTFSLAVGSYNQSPFLREMINEKGEINTLLQSQKSIHYILGMDYIISLYKRPFKFTIEAYHKHLWDVNSYRYDNVLVRYRASNQAIAYAQGIDLRLQGELVKDAESWVNIGILNTKEYSGIQVMKYLDSLGNHYLNPNANGIKIVDSTLSDPGFIPRPSQQLVSFNLFYQDYIPKMPNFRAHLNFIYASGLPFGPPNSELYRNSFSLKEYMRLDIGLSATLYDRTNKTNPKGLLGRAIESAWVTLELFNILDFQNHVSMSWVRDFNNNQLAVPNNLTGRRINARMVIRF